MMNEHAPDTPPVELPHSGIQTRYKKTKNSDKTPPSLPDIDDTIKIPERMASSCWKMLFICAVLTAIALLDARDPLFRVFISEMFDTLIYRLSLENIVSAIGYLYQQLITGTLFLLSTFQS